MKESEQEYQEVGVLVFLLAFTQVLGAPPEIFDEYFQQDVKVEYEITYKKLNLWRQTSFYDKKLWILAGSSFVAEGSD